MKLVKVITICFLSILLFSCSNNSELNKNDNQPTTTLFQNKTSINNYIGSDDKVYGELLIEDKTKTSDNLYIDGFDNIYTVTEEGIFQIMIQLPIAFDLKLDEDHLKELSLDFMEDDAVLHSQISNQEFLYYSSKIDKSYNVTYSLDNENRVIAIYVTKHVTP